MPRCRFTCHRITAKVGDPYDWWEVCDPCFNALVRHGLATGGPPKRLADALLDSVPHRCECPLASCDHGRIERPYHDEGR